MLETYKQGNRVFDFVFPLVNVIRAPDGELDFDSLLGTAFLLHNAHGLGLTAGHVADAIQIGTTAGLFRTDDGTWYPHAVQGVERHPTDDLAIVQIEGREWQSPFFVGQRSAVQSSRYSTWGYPLDVSIELSQKGRVFPRPDLIFSAGHIRRRMTNIKVPAISGQKMYELSSVAGTGCSGAPICKQETTEVEGVYIGERYSESDHVSVGYAVRSDAIADQWPALIETDQQPLSFVIGTTPFIPSSLSG
jgi:hypothetical protein